MEPNPGWTSPGSDDHGLRQTRSSSERYRIHSTARSSRVRPRRLGGRRSGALGEHRRSRGGATHSPCASTSKKMLVLFLAHSTISKLEPLAMSAPSVPQYKPAVLHRPRFV